MCDRSRRTVRLAGHVFTCGDCQQMLHMRGDGLFSFGALETDWFMVKDSVWRQSQRNNPRRFLCIACLEHRIGRKLSATDFRRSAKVNFTGQKSVRLRRRLSGLKPAKRLVETTFTP